MSSFTNSFDSEIVLLGGGNNKIRPSVKNFNRIANLTSEPASEEEDLHIQDSVSIRTLSSNASTPSG